MILFAKNIVFHRDKSLATGYLFLM